MSLNKYDLNAYRRAKRIRALKIDFLIVVVTLAAIIFITREHPQHRPGAPAFHVSCDGSAVIPFWKDLPAAVKSRASQP
jgi:hypothetical protein